MLFASNSTALTPAAKRDLDRIVAYVKRSTTAIVIVQGHSDSVGSSVAKQRTAMDRAHAVEDYLSARGVPHDQLSHTGFSDSRPAASGTATPDPTQDRRVDVIVRDVSP